MIDTCSKYKMLLLGKNFKNPQNTEEDQGSQVEGDKVHKKTEREQNGFYTLQEVEGLLSFSLAAKK